MMSTLAADPSQRFKLLMQAALERGGENNAGVIGVFVY
jgi:hypothetical protein